jgi:hypothetical protein
MQITLLIAVYFNVLQILITMLTLMFVYFTVQLLTTTQILMAEYALLDVLTGLTINMLIQGQTDVFKIVRKVHGEITQQISV